MPREPGDRDRAYSLAEARAALPATIERLNQIARHRADLRAWGRAAEGLSGDDRPARGLPELLQAVGDLLVELAAEGVLVRDLDEGIIDFPGLRADREICWCFRMGEPDIAYWHYPQEGFAGRKPTGGD